MRLRQIALVAEDLERARADITAVLGLGGAFADPGVGHFGLVNAVWPVGDTFLEVVSPEKDGTTAGRLLEKRGGDGGYMAIFQVPDLAAARARLPGLGVRVVWTADLPDIAGTHLHPKDVPGAIVSLDWAEPAGSWRWAGPAWTGQAPEHAPGGGVTGVTIEVADPAAAAARWAAVLGIPAGGAAGPGAEDGAGAAGGGRAVTVELAGWGQRLRFEPARPGHGEGITEVSVAGLPGGQAAQVIGGVRFTSEGG
jgi:catechol 2,3-dioxygenase-like lactoylglutathione lyase family enzyme